MLDTIFAKIYSQTDFKTWSTEPEYRLSDTTTIGVPLATTIGVPSMIGVPFIADASILSEANSATRCRDELVFSAWMSSARMTVGTDPVASAGKIC